jgi:hypothetical protein
LRSSLLGAHLDEFCSALVDVGHPIQTIRHKLWVVSGLARWMAKQHLAIIDFDERGRVPGRSPAPQPGSPWFSHDCAAACASGKSA